MDILVTFEDGSSELRAANSPCILDDAVPAWTPSDVVSLEAAESTREPGLWVEAPGGRLHFPMTATESGARSYDLTAWRDFDTVIVWRIVGANPLTGALFGEWQCARAETVEEQIERLTRDAREARRALPRIAAKLQVLTAILDPEATPDADLPKGRLPAALRLAREALALTEQKGER